MPRFGSTRSAFPTRTARLWSAVALGSSSSQPRATFYSSSFQTSHHFVPSRSAARARRLRSRASLAECRCRRRRTVPRIRFRKERHETAGRGAATCKNRLSIYLYFPFIFRIPICVEISRILFFFSLVLQYAFFLIKKNKNKKFFLPSSIIFFFHTVSWFHSSKRHKFTL